GVILYETLTGELPFRGVARMMLHAIQYEDPRPPRQLNDRIPRDLETITLKCLAKEPHRRYPSAAALHDDVRRYLEHRPILARPAGPVERLARWVRRNPWKASALGLLVVLPVGTTGAAVSIHQARKDAERHAEAEKTQRGIAEYAADVAQKRLNLSLETLRLLISDAQAALRDRPGTRRLQENILRVALKGLAEVVREAGEAAAGPDKAVAHTKIGDIYMLLGRTDDAEKEFRQGRELARAAFDAEPESERRAARESYAVASMRLGDAA